MLKEQTISINGQLLHLHSSSPGHSRSLVLIHGMGVSSRYMLPLANELARAEYDAYVMDLPGFGSSPRPKGSFSIETLANSIEALIRHYDLQKPVLVSDSFGCQVILHLVKTKPQIAAAVILTGPTMNIYERTAYHQILRWLQNLRHEPIRQLAWPITQDIWDSGLWRLFTMLRMGLKDCPEAEIESIELPILLARGELDPIAPRDWLEFLAAKNDHIQIAEVPDAAHAIIFDRPAEVTKLIKSFLQDRL